MVNVSRTIAVGLVLLLGLITGSGCGDVLTEPPRETPVVEAYFYTNRPPSAITLSRTAVPGTEGPSPITDAAVFLRLPHRLISFVPAPLQAGVYLPEDTSEVLPGNTPFNLVIDLPDRSLSVRDTLPPPIQLEEICLSSPSEPVEAVFADSLSLTLKKGWIYPVTVRITWQALPPYGYWAHPRIIPPLSFPSAVVGYFLRTEEILPDQEQTWEGLYAVPVPSREASFPRHRLNIRLLRGTRAYKSFAQTRMLPETREPTSNIPDGRGLAVGLAIANQILYPDTSGTTCFSYE